LINDLARAIWRWTEKKVYLHPSQKAAELLAVTKWLDREKHEFPRCIAGDFNRINHSHPDQWSDLLIKGNITDTAHSYIPLKAPLDRILCLTEYITAAQIDVLIATHRRHHLSGHYQLTARST
jgi:endonuclease/exonuclease/phosphatase family metal-dependent hydrolase